ncbi:MAG TPA: hypothetical protein VFC90_14320 [Planctomycetota bacterium]|nr:hypothetical protein [Planctomycetota bacterium]
MIEASRPLAQIGEHLRQLHQRLVENVGSEQAAQAIEGVGAVLILLVVFMILRRRFSAGARRRRASGRRFRELAKANRLHAGDRQLLLAMARDLDLQEPGLIFVRRSYFEEAAEKGNFKAERVDVLRRELYS